MMPHRSRIRRARSATLFAAGILLALAGLTAAGLEDVSFGHEHVVDGKAVYHHHFHLGPHEHQHPHQDAEPDHDHDEQDHDEHDHDEHDSPVPHHHGLPGRAATIAAAPALFQPLDVSTLAVEPAVSLPVFVAVRRPGALRSVAQPTDPRGPPFSPAAPDSLA